MNGINTSKQLATQEAYKTEIGSWGSQRSGSQCHANYQKTKQAHKQQQKSQVKPKTKKNQTPIKQDK